MLGLTQWSLGESAPILWSGPIGLVLLGALYAVSQAGQRLAAGQSRHLVELVHQALQPD